MNNPVITVNGVSKKYCQTLKHTMSYGIKDIACNFFGISQKSEQLRPGEFWAVKNVSFEVKPGETVGIVGSNGSGKSTILKMLNGIFMPDTGKVEITGKVGALIEVGAGFHPMLTGRENIYVNGAIYGMSRREIDNKLNDIIEFAGIGDFIDSPVKHYSSGMYVRLGFAVAVHCDLDILLIDEVLAVGDAAFQNRCFKVVSDLKHQGKSIVLVTHDMDAVIRHCNRVLLLNKGIMVCEGSPHTIVNCYRDILEGHKASGISNSKNNRKAVIGEEISGSSLQEFIGAYITEDLCSLRASYNKNDYIQGNGKATIVDYFIVSGSKQDPVAVFSGDPIDIYLKVKFNDKVTLPVSGLSIKTVDGITVFGFNNIYNNQGLHPIESPCLCIFKFSLNLPLQAGTYFFDAGVAEETGKDSYDVFERRCSLFCLDVNSRQRFDGLVSIETSFQELTRKELEVAKPGCFE